MKKISLFFVILALLSAQIVKATEIRDATLKEQGKQNEASTVAWLTSAKPDPALITMTVSQFNVGFKACIIEFNSKYKTLGVITDDVINDDIVPRLYTADLDPNKLYTVSYWDVKNQKWGRWTRKAKPGEAGLFYPGWEEPVLSVYCWNFGYPEKNTKPAAPSVKEREVEYVNVPGKTKYIHTSDTVYERHDSYKEVQNNFFLNTNNNTFASTKNTSLSYDVDMSERSQPVDQQQSCNCPAPQRQQRVSYASQNQCICDGSRICDKHYDELPKKHKKKFFNTTGGRVLTHTAAAVGGYFLGRWIFGDGSNNVSGNVVTHGPLDLLPATVPILTQGPFFQ
jgi:hypothetical protein